VTTVGRGRRRGSPDTRAAILDAARQLFAAGGLSGTSVRAVAARAGVDPALVHHYFGSKDDLFVAALSLPVDPREVLAPVVALGPDGAAERMLRTFLAVWDDPGNGERLVAMLRAAQTNDDVAAVMRREVTDDLVGPVTRHTGIDDARQRGGLAAAPLVGLATTRYLLRLEPVVGATPDEIVRWLAPTLQRYLVGPSDPVTSRP
jgi:AcrR family transcriptional regulator